MRLKKEQEIFIKQILEETDNNILLFIHDPLFLDNILYLLIPHIHKIKATFAGHLHLKFLGKLSKIVRPINNFFNLQIIPSTWGLFGIGRGFCILKLENQQEFRIECIN